MDYFKEMPIKEVEKKKHFYIKVDGEVLAHYEKDYYYGDGWCSYIKINFGKEIYSTELRRACFAIKHFKKKVLERVENKGHFNIGCFNSKNYIK